MKSNFSEFDESNKEKEGEKRAAAWQCGAWQSVAAIDELRSVGGPRWRAGAQIKSGPVGHYTAAGEVSLSNGYWTERFKEGVIKAEGNYTLLYVFPKPGLLCPELSTSDGTGTRSSTATDEKWQSWDAISVQNNLHCSLFFLTSGVLLMIHPKRMKKNKKEANTESIQGNVQF